MKAIVGVITIGLLVVSCASVEKLKESPQCEVWEDQGILGARVAQVREVSAKYEGKCTLFGMFWCLWRQADFNPATKRISLEGNSIFESKTEVASLEGKTMTFDPSFWDHFAKSSPAEVDMDGHQVSRTMTMTALGLNKSAKEQISFNDHCTSEQAAVGALALWSGKSKDQ